LRDAATGATVAAAAIPDDARGPLAVSADGRRVMLGGDGEQLLRVWDTTSGAGGLVATCTTERRDNSGTLLPLSLSADGLTVALGWGPEARVLRRLDGARL